MAERLLSQSILLDTAYVKHECEKYIQLFIENLQFHALKIRATFKHLVLYLCFFWTHIHIFVSVIVHMGETYDRMKTEQYSILSS